MDSCTSKPVKYKGKTGLLDWIQYGTEGFGIHLIDGERYEPLHFTMFSHGGIKWLVSHRPDDSLLTKNNRRIVDYDEGVKIAEKAMAEELT